MNICCLTKTVPEWYIILVKVAIAFSIWEGGPKMNYKGRVFGQNLSFYMDKQGISPEEMAEELGYTVNEIYNIIDARQYVSMAEKKNIANILKISVDDLITENNTFDNPCLECRGNFTTLENKNLILDLFDSYCDIQQLLEHYRKESAL